MTNRRQIDVNLADVNVLLALFWRRHVHHSAAQAWFAAQGHQGWATNIITQLGVIRLLTNPSITQDSVSASTALATLAEAVRHPKHQYWPMDQSVPSMLFGVETVVTGHRQWTDLLLLRQAVDRKGKLVTFDKGLLTLAGKDSRSHIVLLKD